MKIKKILVVLPHGICGTGVTRNSIDIINYVNSLNDNNITAECIANMDVNFGMRSKSFDGITSISFLKQKDNVKKYIDNSNIIIFMGAIQKKASIEAKTNFMEIVDYATKGDKTTAYINLDHKKSSLNCRLYVEKEYVNFFEKFDVVFTHSLQDDFIKKLVEPNKLKLKKVISRDSKDIENLFGIDFEKIHNKYYKIFEDKEYKTLKFLGRSHKYKGAWHVRDLHYNYLMNDGWITTIEGIDLLIGTLVYLYAQVTPTKIARHDVNLEYIKANKANFARIDNNETIFKRNSPAYVMPIFINEKALERLSKCQFGIELLMLKDDRFNVNIIENVMLETVAVGSILVVRKHWAEQFLVDKKPLISYGDETGTIFLDEKNPSEAIEMMNKLANNKELYDEWRNKAFKFYEKYYTSKNVYSKIINVLLNLKKD